jgi:hypothetical protein
MIPLQSSKITVGSGFLLKYSRFEISLLLFGYRFDFGESAEEASYKGKMDGQLGFCIFPG